MMTFAAYQRLAILSLCLCAAASGEEQFEPFELAIPGSDQKLSFVPIPAGVVMIGSPEAEADRHTSEGPRVSVEVEPFWMMQYEVTWEQWWAFMNLYKEFPRGEKFMPGQNPLSIPATAADSQNPDVISYPTPLYDPGHTYNRGRDAKMPAACMTPFAAKQFTKWLSMKTGQFYRLPSEAEWEHAARAGTSTAYFFGDDPNQLEKYAWFYDNSLDEKIADNRYYPVGLKEKSPWGLYDIYGNVAEWTLDQYDAKQYGKLAAMKQPVKPVDAICWPKTDYPRTARGGHWNADAKDCRSASRLASDPTWKTNDPNKPQSIWWFTDSQHVGFRVIRPLVPPPAQEQARYWEADTDLDRQLLKKQRENDR